MKETTYTVQIQAITYYNVKIKTEKSWDELEEYYDVKFEHLPTKLKDQIHPLNIAIWKADEEVNDCKLTQQEVYFDFICEEHTTDKEAKE